MPILDLSNKKEVDKVLKFISGKEVVSFMQDISWGKVKNNWEQEIVYLEENDKVVASMMILVRKISKLKTALLYAPRGPVCDVYDAKLVDKLVKEAEPLVKKYNAFCLKFDPQVLYDKKLADKYNKLGYIVSKENDDVMALIQPQKNMVLDIKNKTEDELLAYFTQKTRYNIRLAYKKEVKVRYSRDEKDLKIFYDLYKVTTVRDKIGCRPYSYFKRMLEAYDENNLRIYIVEHEGDNLAAAIAINYGKELFYLYGASSNEKRNLMPTYAMQWEMIKWGLETKCYTYNFGGLVSMDPNNGLYRFKIGFCNEEGIYNYIGEIDKVYNKFIYFNYSKVLPKLKKVKKKFRH